MLERCCYNQFDDELHIGTQLKYDKQQFEVEVNELVESKKYKLVDG